MYNKIKMLSMLTLVPISNTQFKQLRWLLERSSCIIISQVALWSTNEVISESPMID